MLIDTHKTRDSCERLSKTETVHTAVLAVFLLDGALLEKKLTNSEDNWFWSDDIKIDHSWFFLPSD